MPFKIKNEAGEEVEVPTATEVTDMVTGAVKSHLDKATKKITADLTATLSEGLAKTLNEYDTKRQEEAAAAEEARKAAAGNEGSKGPKGTDADIENSPIVRGMQKKLEAQQRKLDESEARIKAEKSKQRDTTLRARISEEMDKLGYDPKARHLALSHLVDGAKLARYTDDEGDSIAFKDTDGSDVDLTTGLKSFAQTDDGKRFMPASGASGTGDRSRFTPPTQPKTGKLEAGSLGRMILQAVEGAPQSPIG